MKSKSPPLDFHGATDLCKCLGALDETGSGAAEVVVAVGDPDGEIRTLGKEVGKLVGSIEILLRPLDREAAARDDEQIEFGRGDRLPVELT